MTSSEPSNSADASTKSWRIAAPWAGLALIFISSLISAYFVGLAVVGVKRGGPENFELMILFFGGALMLVVQSVNAWPLCVFGFPKLAKFKTRWCPNGLAMLPPLVTLASWVAGITLSR